MSLSDGSQSFQNGRMTVIANPQQSIQMQVEVPMLGAIGSDQARDGLAAPGGLFSDFTPAELPVAFELLSPPPKSSVLGASGAAADEVATVEYQADPNAGEVYLLLQEIQTPDGTVYDVSLPQASAPKLPANEQLLGGAVSAPLRFPVHRLVNPYTPHDEKAGEVLGGIGDIATGAIGDVVFKRVLHMLRAPLAPTLRQFIATHETHPQVLQVHRDGTLGDPLEGFAAWRSQFAPQREYRVLLFVHGFLCNAARSLPRAWISDFGGRYDAVLAYNHPTLSADPLQNASALLSQIPDDVQLHVDLIAHSRGGLVVRSLVELIDQRPCMRVRRLLTCGSPHAGTALAEYERWDRLASIGLTAASWLLTATGAAAPLAFVPKLLEYLLRAGAQFVLDLPGAAALIPGSDFLNRLNVPAATAVADRVPYAAVVSAFDPAHIAQRSFREALQALAAQAFMGTPNDLVVPTDSMSKIDSPMPFAPGVKVCTATISHFAYFDKEHTEILQFVRSFLL